MANTIIYYEPVVDSAFALSLQQGPDDRNFTFQLAGDHIRDTSFLMWRMHAQNANNLKYEVVFNNAVIWRTPGGLHDGEVIMTINEIIGGSVFRPGNQEQFLKFQVTGGAGRVFISDVLLFYRRRINT